MTARSAEQYTQSSIRIVDSWNPQQIAAVTKDTGLLGRYWTWRRRLRHGPQSYLYVMTLKANSVRAFDADTPCDRIADALRELMANLAIGSHGVTSRDEIASCNKWSLRGLLDTARLPERT